MQEFLNPKSMLTPGAAGGIVMLIANTLWLKFGILQEMTGLIVSAVLSLLIVARYKAPLWERGAYFVVNGLIIFCVAAGVTGVAGQATGGGGAPVAIEMHPAQPPRLAGLIGTAAAATDEEIAELCRGDDANLDETTRQLCAIIREQREQLGTPQTETPPPADAPEEKERRFFQPWFQQKQ